MSKEIDLRNVPYLSSILGKIIGSVFEGVNACCSWPKCDKSPDGVAVFEDHTELRCAEHMHENATPER